LAFLLLLSLTVIAILVGKNDIQFGSNDWANLYYNKPWSRFSPYMIGVGLALLWKHQGVTKISLFARIIGYMGVAVLLLTTVYGTYTNVNDGWSRTENLFYFTLSHSGYILGLAILSYFMLNQYANLIRDLLSFHIWTPLARLTFGAYLLHPIIMMSGYLSTRHALNWDIWTITVNFLGYTILSYATSLVFWLIFEKPLANMEKEIMMKVMGKQDLM